MQTIKLVAVDLGVMHDTAKNITDISIGSVCFFRWNDLPKCTVVGYIVEFSDSSPFYGHFDCWWYHLNAGDSLEVNLVSGEL